MCRRSSLFTSRFSLFTLLWSQAFPDLLTGRIQQPSDYPLRHLAHHSPLCFGQRVELGQRAFRLFGREPLAELMELGQVRCGRPDPERVSKSAHTVADEALGLLECGRGLVGYRTVLQPQVVEIEQANARQVAGCRIHVS